MITFAQVEEARDRLRGALPKTPCVFSEALSELTGCRVHFKLENLHRTGSFKERGALNKLLCLREAHPGMGLVTASAGNHGQAVAFHAFRLGHPCVVVMPVKTPLVKVGATRNWGAEVILHGANYEEAMERAREIESERGYFFVHGFDDPEVVAGQGTLTLELFEDGVPCDLMLLPIGGGGLIAGNFVALRALYPKAKMLGVEPENCPSMSGSIRAGHPVHEQGGASLADGLAVKKVGTLPFSLLAESLDPILLVSEDEIANAIMVLLEREKTMVEGAGAAAFAALLHHEELRRQWKGRDVVVPLCGGNIDLNILSKIIDLGLAKAGRLGRLRVVVPDQPGSLAGIATAIGNEGGNILEIFHSRALLGNRVGQVTIDVVVETRGQDHLDTLLERLAAAGLAVNIR